MSSNFSSYKTVLENSTDTHKIVEVLQEIGSATISEEGRSLIVKENLVPSIIQVMTKYSLEADICEAGCFLFEGILIDLDKQYYLRKNGLDDCMSRILELNVQNPMICLSCLKVIFSQTLNDEPQVRYDNKGYFKSVYNALNVHLNNFDVSEQAILVLNNLTKFARSLEVIDSCSYIETVSNTLNRYHKKGEEFCENGLETLNSLLALSKPIEMQLKTKIMKIVNTILALYCKSESGDLVDSRLSRLGASSLVYLLGK